MQEQAAQVPGAATPGVFYQSYIDAKPTDPRREQPRRPTTRVLMRVINRNTLSLPIKLQVVGIGETRIEVDEADVADVLAQVEDPALIAAAVKQFANDIAEEVGKALEVPWKGTIQELQALMESRSDDSVNKIHDRVKRVTGNSVEKVFQHQNKRSMLALSFAEVIPGSEHPSPEALASSRETDKVAQAISIALQKQASGGAVPSQADIQALVDARVRELLGEKTGKR